MNFTGILIYSISAKIPGRFIQQPRTLCIVPEAVAQQRRCPQLSAGQSPAGRGRGGQRLPGGGHARGLSLAAGLAAG